MISESVASCRPSTPSKNIFLFKSLDVKPYVSSFNSGCSFCFIKPNGSKFAIKWPLILNALISIIALIESLTESWRRKGSIFLFSIEIDFSGCFLLTFFFGRQLGPSIFFEIISLLSFKPSKKSFQSEGKLSGLDKYSE